MSEPLHPVAARMTSAPGRQAPQAHGLSQLIAGLSTTAEAGENDARWLQMQRTMLVGLIASGYIHDLNNLLTVIDGAALLATNDLPTDHPTHESLRAVRQASRAARELSRRLNAFVRGKPIAPRPVDLYALALEWEPLLNRMLGAITRLKSRIDPELWPVFADPVQIEQVVINLILNARDAMPAGGTVELSWTNVWLDADETLPTGGYICLAVSDSGVGIGPEVVARLFEPFFSTKQGQQGVGLGLVTCHSIVAQLGGAIRVESALGEGSTFRVYLPRYLG